MRRWRRFGAGGAKLIWGEATAVVPEARANPRQLLLSGDTAPDYRALARGDPRRRTGERFGRDDDLLVGMQLTHSGRWSYPEPLIARHSRTTRPAEAPGPGRRRCSTTRTSSGWPGSTSAAAKLAQEAGFDFVDVKQCHTYLLNELLAARTRERPVRRQLREPHAARARR